MTNSAQKGLIGDIISSFMTLPLWVKAWALLILMPVNMATVLFLHEPQGIWITALAWLAMMGNMPPMIKDRGFGKIMALPHIPFWTVLVLWIAFARPEGGSATYDTFLTVLMVVNAISLVFDYRDALIWWRGEA